MAGAECIPRALELSPRSRPTPGSGGSERVEQPAQVTQLSMTLKGKRVTKGEWSATSVEVRQSEVCKAAPN